MALNLSKFEVIYDPSKCLLLVVGFYQRSIPLFLYVFQCCCYLKDIPIGNMISCCRCTGGIISMYDIYYRFNNIFMARGYQNMEVELDSLC